jgi:putative flippase GtrA
VNKYLLFFRGDRSAGQLVRYAVVGMVSNLLGYSVYLLATCAGAPSKTTMSILYLTGAIVGFIGNRQLTFSHEGDLLGTGVRYVIAHSLGYLLNLTMLVVFVDKFGYPHQLVQGFAIFVVAVFLFVAFKLFVFTKTNLSKETSR